MAGQLPDLLSDLPLPTGGGGGGSRVVVCPHPTESPAGPLPLSPLPFTVPPISFLPGRIYLLPPLDVAAGRNKIKL